MCNHIATVLRSEHTTNNENVVYRRVVRVRLLNLGDGDLGAIIIPKHASASTGIVHTVQGHVDGTALPTPRPPRVRSAT